MLQSLKNKEEITQDELFEQIQKGDIAKEDVLLVAISLKDIDTNLFEQMRYNPYEMQKMPTDKLFVFFCDTGKDTKENLNFYKQKLPQHTCISLKGGRGYWRPNKSL